MKKLLYVLFAWFVAMQCAFAAVNINTASKEELDKLPGVGPVKAQAIIDERTKNGPFKNVEDIKRVKGIGDATFDKLKGDISVSGASSPKAEAKSEAKEEKPAKADKKSKKEKADKAEAAKDDKAAAADDKKAAKMSKKGKEASTDKKEETKDDKKSSEK